MIRKLPGMMLLLLFTGCLAACGGPARASKTPPPTLTPLETTANPPTAQPSLTNTPTATATASPTRLPTATATPPPTTTATPTLTATSTSTHTPAPSPTATINFSPLGTPLPTSGAVISAQNAQNLKPLSRLGRGRLNDMAWSPDGKWLAVASATGIQLYDAQTLSEAHNVDINEGADCVSFSPDGTLLAAGSEGAIRIWRMPEVKILRKLIVDWGTFTSVAFSPDGSTLASIREYSDQVVTWRVSDGARLIFQTGHYFSSNLVYSPDGSMLAAASYEGVILMRAKDGKILEQLGGVAWRYIRVAFSPDGQLLAVAKSNYDNSPDEVDLWRVSDKMLFRTFQAQEDELLTSLDFSPDGQTLAIGSENRAIIWRVFEGVTQNEFKSYEEDDLQHILFSPDGSTLAAGFWDHSIWLWRASDGALMGKLNGVAGPFVRLSFSTDGAYLAAGVNNWWMSATGVFSMADGRLLYSLPEGEGMYGVFSPDGKKLVSADSDSRIRLWQASDGKLLKIYYLGLTQETSE